LTEKVSKEPTTEAVRNFKNTKINLTPVTENLLVSKLDFCRLDEMAQKCTEKKPT
jgi:hypothetical protein